MDDTKSLLMMVLHKIFEKQPEIVEKIFQLIHNFNNGKLNENEYEKILKKICDLMNDKLPSQILIYMLTLVDMPHNNQSEIIEKMRKTHDILPEINVRPHLLQYLNNSNNKQANKPIKDNTQDSSKSCKVNKRYPDNSRSLLDICANYVMRTRGDLKRFYRRKQVKSWRLINSNKLTDQQLQHCYCVVKDLNKKIKLLRHIESNKITTKLIEEYTDLELLATINQPTDPFVITTDYENAINDLILIVD